MSKLTRLRTFSHATGFLILLTLCVPPSPSPAQTVSEACDEELQRLGKAKGPHGYRLRDGRCEGIFAQQVSGTPLYVLSLHRALEIGRPAPSGTLVIEWWAPENVPVWLRAEGVSPGLHYRMDTVRPGEDGCFEWPGDLLAARGLGEGDILVGGWAYASVGGQERTVYLPIAVYRRDAEVPEAEPRFVVWTGPKLKEVYVTIAPVADDGSLGERVWDNRPLGYGYYPAERPVSFKLPALENSGLLYIKVVGERKSGRSSTVEGWYYEPSTVERRCRG